MHSVPTSADGAARADSVEAERSWSASADHLARLIRKRDALHGSVIECIHQIVTSASREDAVTPDEALVLHDLLRAARVSDDGLRWVQKDLTRAVGYSLNQLRGMARYSTLEPSANKAGVA